MIEAVITGGRILDGTGAPPRDGDVAIDNGRIVGVFAPGQAPEATQTFSAEGRIVAPGFIDMHTHSDFTLLINPRAESSIHQGVTTEVIGNCGHACAPIVEKTKQQTVSSMFGYSPEVDVDWSSFGQYLDRLERGKPSVNVAPLAGHGPIRIAVMGFEPRHATDEEITEMQRILDDALQEGAVGFSTGLAYAPGANSDTHEVIELAKVAARHNRFYASHLRSEDVHLIDGVKEALQTGREAEVPVQLSHHPAKYPAFGKSVTTLSMVEKEIESGQDITCDLHAYIGGATSLSQLLPPWAFEGGAAMFQARLRDANERKRLKADMRAGVPKVAQAQLARDAKWDSIMVESCQNSPHLIGRTIASIAEEMGCEPEDVVFELLLGEGDYYYNAIMMGWIYSEPDNEAVLSHPTSMIGSDGFALATYGSLAHVRFHPRSFGTYPRILRKFVRERPVLTLQDAIAKMTGRPAQRLGLSDRGTLEAGKRADIVVFDFEGFQDHATYEQPNQYASGLDHVFVNGVLTLDHGTHTGAGAGQVLRK